MPIFFQSNFSFNGEKIIQIDPLLSVLCHRGWSYSRNNRGFRGHKHTPSQYFFSQRPLYQTHPGWVSASYSSPKQKCLPDIPTAGRQFTMSQLENDSLGGGGGGKAELVVEGENKWEKNNHVVLPLRRILDNNQQTLIISFLG